MDALSIIIITFTCDCIYMVKKVEAIEPTKLCRVAVYIM